MLSGRTKNLGVIGSPIMHSLSPAMQNAAIKSLGLDYIYIAMPVDPASLDDAVKGLKTLCFRGFNVTIPHKSAIINLLDEIDEDAEKIGAVNTVVCEDGILKGYNTDVSGFLHPLKERGIPLKGKRATVFGAGGAARAVLWALSKEGAASIVVGARNEKKARETIASFLSDADISVENMDSAAMKEALSCADLIINTTPLGMFPNVDASVPVAWDLVPRSTVVYDIVYTPSVTRFLREAGAHGNETINGVPMLVGQGVEALKLWTGLVPDRGVMRSALEAALRANGKT